MKTLKVSDHVAEKIERLAQERGISLREAADLHFSSAEASGPATASPDQLTEELERHRALVAQLGDRVKQLEEENCSLREAASAPDPAWAAQEAVVSERDRAQAEIERLQSELKSAVARAKGFEKEVAGLQQSRDQLWQDRESWLRERDRLLQQRDYLLNKLEERKAEEKRVRASNPAPKEPTQKKHLTPKEKPAAPVKDRAPLWAWLLLPVALVVGLLLRRLMTLSASQASVEEPAPKAESHEQPKLATGLEGLQSFFKSHIG